MLSSFGADERGRKWDWSARCVGWTALVHDHSRPCRGSELTELHFRLSAKHPDPMSHTSGWEAQAESKRAVVRGTDKHGSHLLVRITACFTLDARYYERQVWMRPRISKEHFDTHSNVRRACAYWYRGGIAILTIASCTCSERSNVKVN
jgi:hypothetical protein